MPAAISDLSKESRRVFSPRTILSVLVLASVLSAWSMVVGDACARAGWAYFPLRQHVLGALAMYATVGALLGLLLAALIGLRYVLIGRRQRWPQRARWFASGLFFGLVGGLSSVSTALWTFSGESVQKTALAVWGPILFASAMGGLAAVGAALLARAFESLVRGGREWMVWAALSWLSGLFVAHIDLTQYVSLYSRVHTILELIAALCFAASYALVLLRALRFERVLRVGGALSLAWLLSTLLFSGVRTWFDDSLRHVWLEEVYVGRMLRRVQVAEAFLADPFHWRGMRWARIERLKARYALAEPKVADVWSAPLAERPERWDALRALRGGQRRYNVVVYYVDTLRADVAADPETMPALERFRKRSLDFRRAYAAGSDTLRSLPVLTGGNYDALETPENDVLRVAKRASYDDALVIAKSAYEFLGKLRPEFYFDTSLVVEDYPKEQQVWGYGAQRPTAPLLVDRALEFLQKPRKDPFFLWLFNFDQHNWRELDPAYVDGSISKHGIVDDPHKLPYRYRAVAHAIDDEFGRLIAALEKQRRLEDTIVLFVSDHGEALGRDGFWVHSVFLWEPLIRVPLVLHVPGLTPRVVDSKVSLVDVAPTLGRYLDPTLSGAGFHGEDLLGYILPEPPKRRFPLLLASASKDLLVRVGLVDPEDEFKLVLSFEAALPELYDLRQQDPDGRNFAAQHRARVKQGLALLLGSPIFPHTPDDFDVRNTRAQRALEAATEEQ
ncbi:MAG TPA: sulfatase [Polyangiaceae bacterium]|nr:sulfatase [Polyangiaceae bacterium]